MLRGFARRGFTATVDRPRPVRRGSPRGSHGLVGSAEWPGSGPSPHVGSFMMPRPASSTFALEFEHIQAMHKAFERSPLFGADASSHTHRHCAPVRLSRAGAMLGDMRSPVREGGASLQSPLALK